MKAIGYIRISTTEQSNYSLEYQERRIKEYCIANNLSLLSVFKDDGESSYTFDRPDFIALEKFIKQNKGITHLIVLDHDRFSRNLAEALLKIKELQDKHNIKVLATTDSFDTDFSDPSTFLMRAFKYMMAESELHRIRQRTKNGINQAIMNGRFVNKAPYGYINARDADNKPIILIDEEKAAIVRKTFKEYLNGAELEELRKKMNKEGYKPRGRSAFRDLLSNPIYAGFLRTSQSKKLIKGIHAPIISETDYWMAQERLNKKTIAVQKREEVPMRGVLRCFCGKLVTAGNSKNARGKYYWYYLCNEHKNNLSAVKLHDQFNAILENISFSDDDIVILKEMLSIELGRKLNERGLDLTKYEKDLRLIKQKITSVEEKYLLQPDISKKTYEKIIGELKSDEINIQRKIAELHTNIEVYYNRLNELIPKLCNLKSAYNEMSLENKQRFLNVLFDNSVYYANGIYRTKKLNSVFARKSLEIKEKGLLIIEQPSINLSESPIRAQNQTLIEQLNLLVNVFVA